MKQTQKTIEEDISENIEKPTQEPIEYFIRSQSFGFKFCFQEAQDPDFAEGLVDSINNKKED